MFRFAAVLSAVVVGCSFLAGCREPMEVTRIDFDDVVPDDPATPGDGRALRCVVGAMITPKEGHAYYQQLLDRVGSLVNRPVVVSDKRTYEEVNVALRDGMVDLAFVCSGPYADGHDSFGLELLAAPVVNGEQVYRADILVAAASQARSLADLQGKTFAFTDPDSNTGKLVPTYMLAKRGFSPETFFARTQYTYAHDRSIEAVANGIVDGAAVDSLVYDNARHDRPELTAQVRILETSEPWAIPPVVVRPDLAPSLKDDLRSAFLGMHDDPKGATILGGMRIDRFEPIEDHAFDSIRDMKRWMEGSGDE